MRNGLVDAECPNLAAGHSERARRLPECRRANLEISRPAKVPVQLHRDHPGVLWRPEREMKVETTIERPGRRLVDERLGLSAGSHTRRTQVSHGGTCIQQACRLERSLRLVQRFVANKDVDVVEGTDGRITVNMLRQDAPFDEQEVDVLGREGLGHRLQCSLGACRPNRGGVRIVSSFAATTSGRLNVPPTSAIRRASNAPSLWTPARSTSHGQSIGVDARTRACSKTCLSGWAAARSSRALVSRAARLDDMVERTARNLSRGWSGGKGRPERRAA